MVSLDLALVYAKQRKQVADLKQLAEEMRLIFDSKEVHREALAALLLFQQAAREELLTVHRVEAFIQYLKKACTNPSLRFKEQGPARGKAMITIRASAGARRLTDVSVWIQ